MLRDLHHVAFVVASVDAARAYFEGTFGLEPESRARFEEQGIDLAIYRLGTTFFEVSAPTRPDTPLGRFLAERGPGVHHVAFGVPDVSAACRELAEGGARLLDAEPRTGRSGWTVANLDARPELGLELQLVQQVTGPSRS
jgi:methylmalonyl-CoA/ethylmalonyl-CoA epimerase